jgi:hypothetical protein
MTLATHSQKGPTVLKFSDARRRLAEYRICLERDVDGGLIPAPAFAAVDACYLSLSATLDTARIELEAAGPAAQEQALMGRFLGAWGELARTMFAATYQPRNLQELERTAAQVSDRGRAILERLWVRIAA